MRKLIIFLVGAAVVAVGAVATLVILYRSATTTGSGQGRPVKVVIEQGSSGVRIVALLERKKVVGSALAFRVFLELKGTGGELRAGEYTFREDMPYDAVLAALRKGPPVKFSKLVIPEGLTVEQTAERVGAQTHITREEFLAAATPATARPSVLPPGIETLEGFLYPKTYRVLERAGAEDVVRQLVDQFEKEAFPSPLGLAANFDLTEYQILVIASLIEEEAKADEERAKISSVIHNRLRRGMKLEIDATVQYAVKKYGQPLTVSDLQVDSPYNTRKFPGLPPTPISSPGIESVEAAVEPAGSDALYYVLTADCTHHFFTASYDEFLREKAQGCLRP